MSNFSKIVIAVIGLALLWLGTMYFRRAPIEQDLTANVRQALSGPEFSNVDVSFEAREGLLTGSVGSAALREEAERLARQYWGVRTIANRIEVEAPRAEAPSQKPAEAAPAPTAGEATAAPVDVTPHLAGSFQDGRLVLSGIVPGEELRMRMVQAAEAAFGAGNVVDDLKVVPGAEWPTPYDAAWSYFLALSDVNEAGFELKDGAFTLSGKVSDQALRYRLGTEAAAALTPLEVRNDLIVSTEGYSDPELQRRLNDYLAAHTVEFHTGSARLTEPSKAILDETARMLSRAETARVEIQGHTDNVGSPEDNLALSARRAESVLRYLSAKGIAEERLRSVGFGETHPIDDNGTPEGRQRNRRVDFKVE